MEYMILRDGSLKLFPIMISHQSVVNALAVYGGKEYYWQEDGYNWLCIRTDIHADNIEQISRDEVPALVLMAAMLE